MPPPLDPSRRGFLALSGAAAAGMVLGACDGGDDEPRRPRGAADGGLLNVALDLEHSMIAAYRVGLRLVDGDAAGSMRAFLRQERAHARRLAREVERLGGEPRPPKLREEYLRSFPALRSGRDALRFAVDLKNIAVRTYLDSVPKLARRRLRPLAASIAANEAAQMSVLLAELGRPPVPEAFVTGKS